MASEKTNYVEKCNCIDNSATSDANYIMISLIGGGAFAFGSNVSIDAYTKAKAGASNMDPEFGLGLACASGGLATYAYCLGALVAKKHDK